MIVLREIPLQTTTMSSLLAGFLVLWPLVTFAEPAVDASDPGFQKAVEQVVERYLLSNPGIIEQTLETVKVKREAQRRERIQNIIAAKQADLLNDPHSPVSGSVNGDVTVVEFFDYRCGYCKRVAGAVTQLQKEDPHVRVVYKDYPILGNVSVFAATAALASKAQGKHVAFHEALLASKNELTQDSVLSVAAQVGLDTKQLQKDMQAPTIQATIERNRALARELEITGTPGFIIGTELIPGAVDVQHLKHLVTKVRQEKRG